MGKKAVDIVLLPDEAMTDKAIKTNAELVRKYSADSTLRQSSVQVGSPQAEIVLDKSNCLPHISIAMGCIEDSDIGAAGEILEKIAEQNPMGKLKVIGVQVTENAKGEKVSVFKVEKTPQLQAIHERVSQELARYFSWDVIEDMICGSDEVDSASSPRVAETTLLWIKNYREKSSFEKFSPHITIGYGQAEALARPIEFRASQLALCHLGNHCTCRKVLASVGVVQI
jgi:2'-5' RNA ligase